MFFPDQQRAAALAATRFGLGARPGEIAAASLDPRGDLLAQIAPGPRSLSTAPAGSAERLAAVQAVDRLDPGAGFALRRSLASAELLARARHGAETDDGFRERWALFWLNHFALQTSDPAIELLAGSFAREAVDPNLFGPFEELLLAVVRHPAMLIALNGAESVGPDSVVGRTQGRGLNENLGREVLELHTLGAGYGQGDVNALALGLAGYTYGGPDAGSKLQGGFINDPGRRQPGSLRLLGRAYPEGEDRAERMLRDLARRPETARRIAFKVARHFVADRPPAALVARLEQAFGESGGSLAALAEALVLAPEAWAPEQRKFKTPYEFLVSAHRALGLVPDDVGVLQAFVEASGHSPLWAPTAKGSSDEAGAWATPLALAQRAEFARALAGRFGSGDGPARARDALGPLLGARTETILRSPDQEPSAAVALALMSPEFQRR